MAANIDSFMTELNSIIGTEKKALTAGYGQLGEASANARQAIQESASAQIDLARVEEDAARRQQEGKTNVANQLDVGNDSVKRAELANQILAARDQVISAHKEMSAITEQKFSDNPLGWIVNQFRQPFVADQVSEAEKQFKDLSGIYSTLDSAAQEGFKTVDALNKADAAAKFTAQTKIIYADAASKTAQLDIQNAHNGINAAKDFGALDLNKNAQAIQLEKMKEDRANHAQAMAMQQAHLKLAQDAQADRQRVRESQAAKEEILKQGLASFYTDPAERANILKYTPAQLEAAIESHPALVSQAYAQGLKIITGGGKMPSVISYGQTPGEAANTMDMTATPESAKWLVDIRKKFAMESPAVQAQQYGVRGTDILFQTEIGADGKKVSSSPVFNAAVEKELLARAKNIDPRDGTNPFRAPSLSQLVSTDPEVTKLGIVRNYLGKLGAAGEESLKDPKALVLGIVKAQPGIDLNQLGTEVATLYSRVRANTNAMNNFIGMGVSPRVISAGYKVDGVDYANPAETVKEAMKLSLQNKNIIAGGTLGDIQFKISNALLGAPK